jgi:membrane-bound serine protease (ClpP class)
MIGMVIAGTPPDFIQFITTPFVSGLLLTVGLLGLLLEMQTLHGIAGVIAIIALALFFGGHVAAGMSAFVILLAVLGLFGILYELHVVPGHGAPGIFGSIALLAAMILAFGPFGAAAFVVALQTVATAIVLTVILFYMATRAIPENAWIAKLTFAGAQGPDYVTCTDFSQLRGHSGIASSYLRPAGVALIDGQRVDVLTQGEFIPEGTPIRVTRVEGSRIFVEPIALPSYLKE